MSKRFVDRVPFVKILLVLVVVFLISLGLCGLVLVSTSKPSGQSALVQFASRAVVYELLGMILSAAGIFLTCVVWIVAIIAGSFSTKVSQSQDPAGGADDRNPD